MVLNIANVKYYRFILNLNEITHNFRFNECEIFYIYIESQRINVRF